MGGVKGFLGKMPFGKLIKRIYLALPGRYSSPFPSLRELKRQKNDTSSSIPEEIPGVDLNVEEQLRTFERLKEFYPSLPFADLKTEELRYYYLNDMFSYSDAITLFCMIRYLQPKTIIEIGSGFSSCLILDTNEKFFGSSISCTFIDPYPKRLLSNVKQTDLGRIHLRSNRLQEIELDFFSTLEERDILFLDSTHVSKFNSDVNYFFFQILPRLRKGVFIQIHDVMYPFDYPKEWIREGRTYNEAYLLRAFLEYNRGFRIVYFNTYLTHFYRDNFQRDMPLCLKNTGGSIWLEKVGS